MSDIIIPEWYKTQWDTQIRLRCQNRGYMLQGTVEPPVMINGKEFIFMRSGQMTATAYSRGDEVSGLNPEDDTKTMETAEYDAAFNVYDWDKSRLAAGATDRRSEQASMALGRQADRIIYDAVMGATIDSGQVFGSYSAAFDPYTFLEGLEKLTDNDAPVEMGVFAPLPSRAFYQLQTTKMFANAEWTGGDLPLTRMGKHKTFDIAHCFILPPHLRKAYTSGTDLRFRVWCRNAVGAGRNDAPRTEWERQATKKRWFCNNTMDAAAKVLEELSIIEFRMKADSDIESEVLRTLAV